MNKFFGGEQNEMRESEIKNNSYLGPFEHPQKLKVGDTQRMQYNQDDIGPFHLSKQKREELKFDCETNENEIKKYTHAQLIDMIGAKTNQTHVGGSYQQILDLAKELDIPTEYKRTKIQEGWFGKPKGMIQILWERGFINPNKSVRDYTKNR